MEEKKDLSGQVFKISGQYPDLSLEDPTGRSRAGRPLKRTEAGAGYEMEKAVKTESQLRSEWRNLLASLEGVLSTMNIMGEHGFQVRATRLKQPDDMFRKLVQLKEGHTVACRKIEQSQNTSEEIEACLEVARKGREPLEAEMNRLEGILNELKVRSEEPKKTESDDGSGKDEPMRPSSAKSSNELSERSSDKSRRSKKSKTSRASKTSKSGSTGSTVRSQGSETEKIRAQFKMKQLEQKMKMKKLQTEAAVAQAEAAAAKEKLELEEQFLDAQNEYLLQEELLKLDREQELGSDDPDAGDKEEVMPKPSGLQATASAFVPMQSTTPFEPPLDIGYQVPPSVVNPLSNVPEPQQQAQPSNQMFQPPTQPGPHAMYQSLYDLHLIGPPEIRKFDGQAGEWIRFYLAFNETYASRIDRDSLKLQKLIQYTGPKVHEKIKMYQHDTVHGFERAMTRLWEIYGHPLVLVNDVIEELIGGQQQIRIGDKSGLLDFCHKITCALETIEIIQANNAHGYAYDYVSHLNNQEVLLKLLKILPPSLARDFVDTLGIRPGTVRELCTFLKRKSASGAHPLFVGLAKGKEKEEQKERGRKKGVFMSNEEENKEEKTESFATAVMNKCPCCTKAHDLTKCKEFNEITPFRRRKVLGRAKLCFNCFRTGHFHDKCEAESKCKTVGCMWKGKHDSRVHREVPKEDKSKKNGKPDNDLVLGPENVDSQTQADDEQRQGERGGTVPNQGFCSMTDKGLFLATIGVKLVNPITGKSLKCFAMLDGCSSFNVVTQEAVDLLGLNTEKAKRSTNITTVTGTFSGKLNKTVLEVAHVTDEEVSRVLDHVKVVKEGSFDTNRCPTVSDRKNWPEYASVVTSEEVDVPRVLLLISMRHTDLQKPRATTPTINGIYAAKTRLGFAVYGGEDPKENGGAFFSNDQLIDQKLNKLIELDEVDSASMYDTRKMPSLEERRAAEKINKSVRFVEGKYEVSVPWKNEDVSMPDNRAQAFANVESRRKKFRRDPEMFKEYNEVIQTYINNGHAERVPDNELNVPEGKKHYLMHHSVKHKRKKKRRVVFNASHKVRGISVNDLILSCPDKLERLIGLLIRFRENPIAVTGDIVAFFHNIRIPKEDRDFGRFVWFKDGDVNGDLVEYRLVVHLFGGIASQGCAVTALNHALSKQAPDNWTKEFAEKLIRCFYSDDFLASFAELAEALEVVEEVTAVLKENGFELAKLRSNNKEVDRALQSMGKKEHETNEETEKILSMEESALGIVWKLEEDVLAMRTPPVIDTVPRTKRGTLSFFMSIYDPLGLAVPFVLPLKLFLQTLVTSGIDWDEPLALAHEMEFGKCLENIRRMEKIHVKRCYTTKAEEVASRELHCFADGSTQSMGCCVYLRTEFHDGEVEIQLVMAKNKLAPSNKSMTVPRIELTAAVLVVRLQHLIQWEMTLNIDRVQFWSDSISTLRYIKNTCKRFQVYVSNRISEIQDRTNIDDWRYVPTKENPADLASRPVTLKVNPSNDAKVAMWYNGPQFLRKPRSEWPDDPLDIGEVGDDDPELKAVSYAAQSKEEDDCLEQLMKRSPSLFKMKYRFACLQKFGQYLREKGEVSKPNCEDLRRAEKVIIRIIQRREFGDEVKAIQTGRRVEKSKALSKLCPFLDDDGILRVGTRLTHGDLPYEYRFPAILPKDDHVTHLLVHESHAVLGHQGTNAVMSHLRRNYWIVGARSVVKKLVGKCMKCRRYHARLGEQLMGDLPKDRILIGEPFFTHTSVDLFGHFNVKRARSTVKRYIALFCCKSSRAVHLEVVWSLEMDSFLNAFRRFQARRGQVRTLLSDNATNFRSADREMREVIKQWNDQGLGHRLQQKGIDWQFLPSRASHQGGLHERLIRVARSSLRHVLESQVLDDESLLTLVTECEFVMNSRPLTAASEDPSDLAPICPNDVLVPRPGSGLPPGDHPPGEHLRRRWRTVQQLTCMFWKRFYKEYLSTLSLRTKWLKRRRDFCVGDLVLVGEQNVPRAQWNLGRIEEVFKGRDNHVRSCRLRTTTSPSLVRPVVKLCLLEASTVENE